MLELRPYQRAALDSLFSFWAAEKGNGLLVLPTGAGKSLVLAALCQEVLTSYPALRIGVVTHVRELIAQNYQELLRLWPQAPAGIYSAGIGRRDARAQILFCGIQSVHNKTDQLGAFDILLVDEAHLIPANTQTTYGRFIKRLLDITPDMRVVGLTATPFRLDSGRLDRGKERIFEDVVYEANVADLIEQGYLSPLVSKATAQQLDVSGVGRRGGEFIPGALEIAVDKDWITRAAVDEIAQFGADRKAWLAFCAGVDHAAHVRDAIRLKGFSCETVTGETNKGERDRIVRQFKDGQIRCLTSVGVLGTGFNVPHVDLIALLRPTASAGLYIQQIGRGLRTAPNKQNCLVLDFARNIFRHGPIDTIQVTAFNKKDGDGEKQVLAKSCPNCATLVALNAASCPSCSFLWPIKEEPPKHEATADANSAILSKGAPAWVPVDTVYYYLHRKDGSPDSLRVEYHCGFTVHKEWICFSHQGFARQKAESWWSRSASTLIPRDTAEALSRALIECRHPQAIQVRPSGRYFEITGRRYQPLEAAA